MFRNQLHRINKQVVKSLTLIRFMGKWFEIARFDHRFERGLVGVTAYYTLMPNGKIKVVNSGYKNSLSGERKQIIGKAKIPDDRYPGKLKVSFFLWFYQDYYVLELDKKDYEYALIGSSSDKYLWILSRTPELSEATTKLLLTKARKRGYDITKLIWTKQEEEEMDYQITHDPEQNHFKTIQNGLTAYIEYERFENGMNFVHTIVPMPLEGQGIGSALVKYALDFAKKNSLKIIPTCSFVEVYLRRHPEYNSMLYIK